MLVKPRKDTPSNQLAMSASGMKFSIFVEHFSCHTEPMSLEIPQRSQGIIQMDLLWGNIDCAAKKP